MSAQEETFEGFKTALKTEKDLRTQEAILSEERRLKIVQLEQSLQAVEKNSRTRIERDAKTITTLQQALEQNEQQYWKLQQQTQIKTFPGGKNPEITLLLSPSHLTSCKQIFIFMILQFRSTTVEIYQCDYS